jgi:hypothetical protein
VKTKVSIAVRHVTALRARRVLRRSREAQRGLALLNAMLLVSLFTIMLMAGMSFTKNASKLANKTKSESQVYNIARAGLVDAINWFKRQASQPVTQFRPAYNLAVPTKGDTNDPFLIDPGPAGGHLDPSDTGPGGDDKPHLGIVQEFQLDDNQNLWARYEVGKVTKLERDSNGKLTVYSIMETDASGNWLKHTVPQADSHKWEGVQDVTGNYGLQGQGLIWRIRSHGYIYRKDPQAPPGTRFYQYPNEVLDQIELETEIRRLQVNDYLCGIHTTTNTTFNNGTKVKIVAPEGYAVKYTGGSISPATAPTSFTSGLGTPYKNSPQDDLDWFEMFAVADGPTLASLADFTITDLSQLPMSMSTMAITYIKPPGGTATFDQQRPLNGGGILVVDGNLTIAAGSASTFSGVIYVRGNYFQSSPTAISGQVIVRGASTVESPSDTANIEYNPSIINEIRRQLGQYRERRSGLRIASP